MKYAVALLCVLGLAGCAKPTKPYVYVCFNPLFPIQGVEVDPTNPRVQENLGYLQITDESGNVVTVPKSLCIVLQRAAQ